MKSKLVPELMVQSGECFDLSWSSAGSVLVCYCALLMVSRLYEQYLICVIHYFRNHEKGKEYSLTTKQQPLLSERCCWHRQMDPGLLEPDRAGILATES